MIRNHIIDITSMEEVSVELLAREIYRNDRILYKENPNKQVDVLRRINRIAQIRESDLDFAVSLFGKKITRRYQWLKDRVDKYLLKYPEDTESLYYLLGKVKGIK